MKLIKVKKTRKTDASDITAEQADKQFYALYDPLKKLAQSNVKKMYQVLYKTHDSILNKRKEFEEAAHKFIKYGPNVVTEADLEAYPVLKKKKEELGKLEEIEKHIDFTIKELGKEFLAKFGGY